jgi:hypothetical protein
MAFYKWALEEIDGFDPLFRKAGDDVDVCWRLRQHGYKITFSHAGFVWHYRRSTIRAYLKQQAGYGEAEALLVGKHPENFNLLGGALWHGRIYAPSKYGLLLQPGVIYRGIFASGPFQRLYTPAPSHALMFCTSLEYHLLLTFPLLALSIYLPMLLPLPLAGLALSFGVCVLAAVQAEIPVGKERFWSRPLIAALCFLQPLVRGWTRYRTRLHLRSVPGADPDVKPVPVSFAGGNPPQLCFWSENGTDRYGFLKSVLADLSQNNVPIDLDSGWENHDLEILKSPWTRSTLITASEYVAEGKIFLRCRLRARWSALALTFFLLVCLAELLIIRQFATVQPWVWMTLPTLALLCWLFEQQCQEQYALLAGAVRRVATNLGLKPFEHTK